jgi:hypothetical protein
VRIGHDGEGQDEGLGVQKRGVMVRGEILAEWIFLLEPILFLHLQ